MNLSFSLQEFWNQREWPCGWQMTPVKLEKKDVYSHFPYSCSHCHHRLVLVCTHRTKSPGQELTPQSQAGPETGKLTQPKGHIDE